MEPKLDERASSKFLLSKQAMLAGNLFYIFFIFEKNQNFRYSCKTMNKFGIATSNFHLRVLPKVVKPVLKNDDLFPLDGDEE